MVSPEEFAGEHCTREILAAADRIDFVGIGAPKSGTTWLSTCRATRSASLQRVGNLVFETLRKVPLDSNVVASRPFEKAILSLYRRINQRPMKYPPIMKETRQRLAAAYRDDVERLEGLIERGLSAWHED